MTTLIGNRYRLYEKLGVGGMGAVFRAEDRLTGDILALKRVTLPTAPLLTAVTDADSDADHMRLALSREFRMLASLRHPNIISVIDYGFDTEREPFFTMDWLQNAQSITLAGLNTTPEERARLLAETLRALAYLHRRGVIHRDLKPANVLVERHGRVKVLDFGLALDRSAPLADDQLDGGMTGTLAYLAPELLTDSPPSISSDLYAVGIMAYEMFAGKYPYSMKNAALLIREIFGATPDFSSLPARLLPIIARLLLKTPRERYQSADEVVSDLAKAFDQSFGADSIEIRESYIRASTFVGREEELAQLGKALDAAFAGRGSAWLVGGESGVGKTRLLDELRIRALVKGALVVRGKVSEQGRVPYELWRDVLRRLTVSTEFTDLEAGVLHALIPDIETLIGRTVPPAPPLDGAASLQRLKLTITDVLARQKQPLVMLLEDLQWGAESVDILSHVAASAGANKWLIIGTYRDDEAPSLPDELPHTRVIKLARLSDSEIATLSAAMLGEVGRQSFVLDLLKKESEGNTFFITEVVRVILDESGGMNQVGRVTLPTSVVAGGIQQVIRRRLERVPAWARPALQRAAVAGREIDLKLLPAFGVTDPETWLAACANAAVIEVMDGEWNFSHDKLRSFILRDIAADELVRLNRGIAEALEVIYPDNPAYAETLAEHWRAAGEHEKAFAYALTAGEYLIGMTAEYERAERLLLQALNLASERAHVRNLLGEAALRRGHYDIAIGHYQVVL
ncbi:MAG: DUF2791 family P-loop domain-containing protein, partial [Anaerolinea sp.]|nr:DUF2791 family P-loop domain-containing protein [Anaerolinea sp.]